MKLGILLLNMGGPDSVEEVLPFLTNLFNDPNILGIRNGLVRKALASYIVSRRLRDSIGNYEKIGGRSPLNDHARAFGSVLEQVLAERSIDAMVRPGMLYAPPRTPDSLRELLDAGCDRILAFSMYPHYSRTTSGSSLQDFHQAMHRLAPAHRVLEVACYPDQQGYIRAMRQRIDQALGEMQTRPLLLFSAHSLPTKVIEDGDPYLDHIQRTVAALMHFYTDYEHELVFQSRATRSKWLEPDISARLPELVDSGHHTFLVIPVSFVSDHIETLYELDMEYREMAEEMGVQEYVLMPGLNDSRIFAEAAADMIQERLEDPTGGEPCNPSA